jgi:hypothetical protein
MLRRGLSAMLPGDPHPPGPFAVVVLGAARYAAMVPQDGLLSVYARRRDRPDGARRGAGAVSGAPRKPATPRWEAAA